MRAGIVGASGYVGGELLRLLLLHPKVEVTTATSRRYRGKYVHRVHPNLRGITDLKFSDLETSKVTDLCDILFTALPHGVSSRSLAGLFETGLRIIDTSADFRLKDQNDYPIWYKWKHPCPELLKEAVYGLPELHRKEIKNARLIACPGCMAISAILALAPVVKANKIERNRIVVDAKIGSSGAGAKPSSSTHHAERSGVVRPYKPVGHRHTSEIEQELSLLAKNEIKISMSSHAVSMVRGILATCHTFMNSPLELIDVWRLYRDFYDREPFIRMVRDRKGIFRFPDPKILVGSNYCDIGFDIDERTGRLVVMSAIDNLIKGAAGTAVQNMNITLGFNEKDGLYQPGLHPV
jgi:N-acetyl-gamma-glutamyl-phosphate/LysW-gamma-L-alpha-aminoadipyl-6-phosphate reductase